MFLKVSEEMIVSTFSITSLIIYKDLYIVMLLIGAVNTDLNVGHISYYYTGV